MADNNTDVFKMVAAAEGRLDGDNYPMWAYMMQHVLVSKGVCNIVEGIDVHPGSEDVGEIEDVAGLAATITAVRFVLPTAEQARWDVKDAQAPALIALSMKRTITPHICSAKFAKKAWDILVGLYASCNEAKIALLRNELESKIMNLQSDNGRRTWAKHGEAHCLYLTSNNLPPAPEQNTWDSAHRVSPRKTRSTKRRRVVIEESADESDEDEAGQSAETHPQPTDSQESSDNAEKRARQCEMMRTAVAAHQEEPTQKKAWQEREKESYERSRGSSNTSTRVQEEEIPSAQQELPSEQPALVLPKLTIIELPTQKEKPKAPTKKTAEVVEQPSENILSAQPHIPFILEQLDESMPSPSSSSLDKSYEILELEGGSSQVHVLPKSKNDEFPASPTHTEIPSEPHMPIEKEIEVMQEEIEVAECPPKDTKEGKEIHEEQLLAATVSTAEITQQSPEWNFGEELLDQDHKSKRRKSCSSRKKVCILQKACERLRDAYEDVFKMDSSDDDDDDDECVYMLPLSHEMGIPKMEEKEVQKEVGKKSLEEPLDTPILPQECAHEVEVEHPLIKFMRVMSCAYEKSDLVCEEKHVIHNNVVCHDIQS
ncbi:hypothetical protein L7F22_014356 [Adiantum nelumboides]|nr:hypothetical protein [Adiantum nelumboides]